MEGESLSFFCVLSFRPLNKQERVASAHFIKLSVIVCPNRVAETVYGVCVVLSSFSPL